MSDVISSTLVRRQRWLTAVTRTTAVALLAAGACVTATTERAAAQGWIEPRPGIAPVDWSIEKLRTSVTVRINGRVAEVEVEEWFRNNGGRVGEGDYVYPLVGEAVFSGYSLYQGDQELRGEMMNATQAREIYERIVREQRDPALIELVGKGMLRARVFPIEAGQTRRIQLRYTQVLERAGDAVQYRYAAGVRHGAPGAVPLPTPTRGEPRTRGVSAGPPVAFRVIVDDATRYRDAFSPTHEIAVQRERGRMTVTPRERISGDFSVFFPFAERDVGISIATHRPAGEDGYFMLTLSPREVLADVSVPRDVTVAVDVSGSMSGEKMEQARRALTQLIGTLGRNDRLRLIAFSSTARSWRDGWTTASPAAMNDARAWVADLRAEGGTNIHDALAAAFNAESPPSRLPIVIFMTDGLPTNGETRPDQIVAMAERTRGRTRVFAFGVGFDVNTFLLDRLSEAARGTTQYVRPDEDVEQAVSVLAAKVRHPVLTDLVLVRGDVTLSDVYPRDLPDLFAGEDLVLFGRFSGSGSSRIGVSGRRNETPERYTTDARLPAAQSANDFIPRLWAARRLGDLDRRIRSAQADGASPRQVQTLMDELRATALRYGLLSEYTAYLVMEPAVATTAARTGRQVAPSAPPPSVSGQTAVARAEEASRARAVTSVAQMEAVQKLTSERIALDAMVVMPESESGAVRRVVAGRTFQLQDSVWIDATFERSMRTVDITAFSDAYFAVLRALPELEPILAQVEAVVIAGRRVAIRVTRNGTVRTLGERDVRALRADFR